MIRPASSNGYINHWNETKRKSKKKIGDILSHVTIGTNVTKGVTSIRIHRYSCYIVLDTEMQAFSLKLPLLHLFRSLHGKRCPQFFGTFLFRYVSVYTYTHQNPWLLLLHTARHRDAGLIIETPFVTFVPIVTRKKKMSPILH